jgi:hypothetical protein
VIVSEHIAPPGGVLGPWGGVDDMTIEMLPEDVAAKVNAAQEAALDSDIWDKPFSWKLDEMLKLVPDKLTGAAQAEWVNFLKSLFSLNLGELLLGVLLASLSSWTIVASLGGNAAAAIVDALHDTALAYHKKDLVPAAKEMAQGITLAGVGAITALILRRLHAKGAKAMEGTGPAPSEPVPPETPAPNEEANFWDKVLEKKMRPPSGLHENPKLLSLRGLSRSELLEVIRKELGRDDVILWEQLESGEIRPVIAGSKAGALGVRPDTVVAYDPVHAVVRTPVGGNLWTRPLGPYPWADEIPLSPYGDPYMNYGPKPSSGGVH